MSNFNIKNDAFRIGTDELVNVPVPFIAHTNLRNGEFIVVHKKDGNDFIASNEQRSQYNLRLNDFIRIFSGVVLTIEEPAAVVYNKPFSSRLNELRLPFIAIATLLIFITGLVFHTNYFENYNWQMLLLTTFKAAGLITSILLLIQSMDNNNPLIQRLCQAGGNTDCRTILSSKAAKIFEGLSWSEIGFFYFAGTLLALFFGNHSISLMQVLAVLNFVSLPYTFYSIYYQASVAKHWCVLCCTIQALLWLEFIPSITAFDAPFTMPSYQGKYLVYCNVFTTCYMGDFKAITFKVTAIKADKAQLDRLNTIRICLICS